tara:strand:+ start:108 stop:572 length:465 start_codon:yes stop_codon:yes gene_type:complete
MKSIGKRTITGTLENEQQLQVLENMLPHIGYRVIDFRVAPVDHDDFDIIPGRYSIARLDTIGLPPLFTTSDPFLRKVRMDANTTVGFAYFSGGNMDSMFDPNMLITQDLFITNMEDEEKDDPLTNFVIVLEKFDISSDEQIMSLLQENSQDMSR